MRVCMIAYTFYELDNRVKRYAEALAQRGDHVDVVALMDAATQKKHGLSSYEKVNGVHLYRIQKRLLNERTKLSYLYRLLLFLVNSALFLACKHCRKRYDVIHIHSIPDFEVFAALLPKYLGAKIILDIHDIVPEFYASKFNVTSKSLLYKCLLTVEKDSIAFSHHVIIANHLWWEKLCKRSVSEDKCSVFLNYPDQAIFSPRPKAKKSDKFTLLYPGTLNRHQGLDVAIRALAIIKDQAPNVEFHIYGEGPEKPNLQRLTEELQLQDTVFFKNYLPIEQIADAMANADLGIVPKRKDSFGNEAFSTKIFEFMSLGIPVIAADTKIDTYYFDDSMIQFFESGNENDLAACLLKLIKTPQLRKSLAANALKNIEKNNSWELHKKRYFDLLDTLCAAK